MKEHFKEEALTQEVKRKTVGDLIANETGALSKEETVNKKEQPENLCSYMGIIALEAFVAELYINYIMCREEAYISPNLIRTIENAVWELDDSNGFDEPFEGVMYLVNKHFGEIGSNTDILLLHIIRYTRERHTVAYYLGKAEELAGKLGWEIQQHKDLTFKIDELSKQDINVDDAIWKGRHAYDCGNPKPVNPYNEDALRDAWYIGHEMKRIEELWKSNVNESETALN